MPKMKTRSCVAKRFKLTAKGHVKRKKAYKRHLLGTKARGRKRDLRKTALVDQAQEKKIKYMLNH
jgi:large subunit ribosomal protein L35